MEFNVFGGSGEAPPTFQPGRLKVGGARFMETKGRNCSKAHSSQAGVGTRVSPPPSHGAALPPCGRARHVSHARRPLPSSPFLLSSHGTPRGIGGRSYQRMPQNAKANI